METIATALRRRRGLDLDQYQRTYARRRVLARARALGLADLDAYAEFFTTHPREAGELIRSLSIQVTHFFRNPSFFQYLDRRILPQLLGGASGPGVEIWSAGCATGEEAYSIAMLLAARRAAPPARVLGTDLDPSAIAAARRGLYPASAARYVPRGPGRFLAAAGPGQIRVDDRAAAAVRFRVADLFGMPRRPLFDLVLCRNVLIYFEPALQAGMLDRLVATLRPGGFLALGRAEGVAGAAARRLGVVSAAECVYRIR
ncbi:MAG TPA: CheR family methyltransferase [Candidatus Polarisedimenticolia bacterium]|nr:CheR family methyltransferase [Candidatus Polarisedimenticolia bacterium]